MFNLFGSKSPRGGGKFSDIYELLFCDDPERYLKTRSTEHPWSVLKNPTKELLDQIISNKASETRVKLIAYKLLQEKFHCTNPKELLGVVIEVPQAGELDVLACYSDKTARYINQGKKLLVWDKTDDPSINRAVNAVFKSANVIFDLIGPWDKPRLPAPKSPMIRITLLSPDGLYFGQGPSNVFFKDNMAGPTLAAATELLKELVAKSERK